ncbi:MAG: hypothetical protein LC708_02420, partial [Actinobacteria bacterium]|nr:hypothetical protein [Actinomycetota bacterium]
MARILGALLMVWGTLIVIAGPASAGVFFAAGPNFANGGNPPVQVGDTNQFATVTIVNSSDGPEALGNVTLSQITLIPSCSNGDFNCAGGANPGVFQLVGPFVGEAGTACAGKTFNVTVIDPVTGKVAFTPTDGIPVVLTPPGTPGATCRIDFLFNVLKAPVDASPAPNLQTNQFVSATGTSSVTGLTGAGIGSGQVNVIQATPAITTAASPGPVTLGTGISDTATLTGGAGPAPGATGTIVFRVFGPGDAACAAPLFTTAAVPVLGDGVYNSPAPNFVPATVGTFQFIATYSGDLNNAPTASLCNDPAEAVVVTQVTPTLVTVASPAGPVQTGTPLTDQATLSGGAAPTGTITFQVFGPDDFACAGPPIFTSAAVPVAGNAVYNSPPPNFVPTVGGSYQFVAIYSGDANNAPVTTACGVPAETVSVQAVPSLSTVASPSVPVGGTIFDTANLSGGTNPTGTITFNLYGPGDPTCAGPPIATSTVPVAGNGLYPSGNFVVTTTPPFTGAGTYRFTATYSGDANNVAVGPTACADPNEDVLITPVSPQITTTASASVPVGGTVTDTATLTGGAGPTGTITFNLYGPTDPNCLGAPVFTSTVPVVAAGAVSAPFVLPNSPTTGPGTY